MSWMNKKYFFILLFSFISTIFSANAFSAIQPWLVWLADLKQEAVQKGINPQFFDFVFQGVTPNHEVLHLDNTQPERRISFVQYRQTRVDALKLQLGKSRFSENRELLSRISQHFGVDPCIIVSIWGMETSYGRVTGRFFVIKSLASLAYDSKRADFFRKELLIALRILQDGHIALANFKGEWAGASGQPQFLPSSWKKYAVDFDGDGHKNIWTSKVDALASIANYLAVNGWKGREPWGVEVALPSNFDYQLIANKKRLPVSSWQKMGVRTISGGDLPAQRLSAEMIQPFGGPYLLAYPNFRVLQTYNPSRFYVGTVGYLADKICERKF